MTRQSAPAKFEFELSSLGRGLQSRVSANKKGSPTATLFSNPSKSYSVDSISKPQASSSGSGIYFEFLFRRAHSRSRVDRKY